MAFFQSTLSSFQLHLYLLLVCLLIVTLPLDVAFMKAGHVSVLLQHHTQDLAQYLPVNNKPVNSDE